MTSFALEPIYGSLALAMVVTAGAIAVILWVTPPTENRGRRRWLIGLRLLAAAVLLLSVFRPALLRTDNRPVDAALVVAVDTSRSMTLPDGDGSERWTTQVAAWQRLARGLADLDDSLNVRLVAYDATARTIPEPSEQSLDGRSPDGELTDLSVASLAAIQAAEGQPIAGIVLMGDGMQTAPLKGAGAQRVVETLRSLGVPLWSVPIGPPGGDSTSRDVAIDSLLDSFQMFSGNQVDIEFQVLTRGLTGIEIPVRLSWTDASGETTEAAARSVTAERSDDTQAMTITVTAPPPGTYRLQVDAPPQSGELITTNNRQIAFVDVREGGGRILYLEGALREEQTFLRRSLRRVADLDLTFRWIPEDTSGSWPIDMRDQFEPGKYDIYILGDLDADALGEAQLGQLADTVAAGAGLLTLGGYRAYGAGGYATSPLAAAIPVEMNPTRRGGGTTPSDDAGQLKGPLSIRLARRHPITDLRGENLADAWSELPPMLGANRWVAPRVAPGVQVLLESSQGDPVLVIGQYGEGRTAAVAFDSTWKWWRGGQSEAHRRFWRQLVLWLLSREETGQDRILIDLDRRRFAVQEPPEFRARVEAIAGTTGAVDLVAEVVGESGQSIDVDVISESRDDTGETGPAASIRGRLPKLEPGIYRLRVRAAPPHDQIEPEELAFQVIDESRELAQPMADPVYLRQLAALTADDGGGAFTADQMQELLDRIAQRRKRAETPIIEKSRLGDGPISGWLLFTLFAGALSTEWFLRRRWDLV